MTTCKWGCSVSGTQINFAVAPSPTGLQTGRNVDLVQAPRYLDQPAPTGWSVSYTHLTLPTILRV